RTPRRTSRPKSRGRAKGSGRGVRNRSRRFVNAMRSARALGTRARLAMELFLNTAQRRGDVVRMGPQHIRDDPEHGPILHVRQQKPDVTLHLRSFEGPGGGTAGDDRKMNNGPLEREPMNNEPLEREPIDREGPGGATAGDDRKMNNEPLEREPMNNEPLEREPIDRVRARLEALLKANAAPRCGARSKRTGKPCRGAAMPNGRCSFMVARARGRARR